MNDLDDLPVLVERQQPRRASVCVIADHQRKASGQSSVRGQLVQALATLAGAVLEHDLELEIGHQRGAERLRKLVQDAGVRIEGEHINPRFSVYIRNRDSIGEVQIGIERRQQILRREPPNLWCWP